MPKGLTIAFRGRQDACATFAAAWLLLVSAAPPVSGAEEPPPKGAPEAIPLLDGETALGRWIALTGETSLDPEGKPQAYEWSQVEGPSLRGFSTQTALPRVWVLLEEPGKYRFTLRARNGKGWSAPAPLEFAVAEGRPVLPLPEAFAPTGAGEKVVLPGEAWRQLHGHPLELRASPDGRETVFRPLVTGLYLFEALHGGDVPERRAIYVPSGRDDGVGDRRPVAVLPPTLCARAGQPLALDASLSYDPDGPDQALEAQWSVDLVHGASLVRQGRLKASFLAPREGVYRLRLNVSDGKLDSFPAERFIEVSEQGAPAGSGDSMDVHAVPGRPAANDPLAKRVSLRLYESDLDWAVQRFPAHCGVALRVDKALMAPDKLRSVPLHLGGEQAPVRLLADWIALQSGGRYRVEPNGALWLTTGLAWAEQEKLDSLFLAVDALHQAPDAADLLGLLRECLGGVLALCPDAVLKFQPGKDQLLAVLPLRAARRLRDVVANLRAPKGLGLPPPLGGTPEEQLLRRALGEKTLTYECRARRLDLVLRDVAEVSGLGTGFEPRHFPEGLPRLTLKLDGVLLREALRELVLAAGFDGCQPVAAGGLWFYRGGEPYPSGELLWDTAVVRAYDLEPILARLPELSGEAVAHHVRQRVFPDSWRDGAACVYHAPTGKLLVVHGPDAQERVLVRLWDLLLRGEWALGPALSATPAP
jgi:hypothetical protein